MRPDKRGTILITTLWILIILSILAIGIGFRVSIEARLARFNMDRLQGSYLAKAGIVKALRLLSMDHNAYDSIWECGITLPYGSKPSEVFSDKFEEGSYRIGYRDANRSMPGLMDEERRINVNTADISVLTNIFGSDEIASSIINWRSPKGAPTLPKGAPDNHYESLPAPYKCKHAPFSCIEELLLVKDVTPAALEKALPLVTVYGDGKVNINTADAGVMTSLGLSSEAALAIDRVRRGPDGISGTRDDRVFSSISEAQSVLTERNDITTLGNLFTTVSNYFRIDSNGSVDRSKVDSRISCVIKRGERQLRSYREY